MFDIKKNVSLKSSNEICFSLLELGSKGKLFTFFLTSIAIVVVCVQPWVSHYEHDHKTWAYYIMDKLESKTSQIQVKYFAIFCIA